jgi:hypothetical protein
MFRPSMGVIIRSIDNYKFIKIHEMYVCLMGSNLVNIQRCTYIDWRYVKITEISISTTRCHKI